MVSPRTVVGVVGTGTEVGKTWTTAAVARALRAGGVTVAARKPVQSFAADHVTDPPDASVLAAATGEREDDVCPKHRSYRLAMAPPMAADALGRAPILIDELVTELSWPAVDVGFVETVGGVRSPIAADGDSADLLHAIAADLVLLVADAGLGTINLVRLAAAVIDHPHLLVFLNRFEDGDDLHHRNRSWLRERDGFHVACRVDDIVAWIA